MVFKSCGNGFEVDYKKAKELWTEVAKKIDWSFSSKAQYFLGLLFYYGNGVEIDYGITMKYFLLASSRWSFAPAMNKIGELYEKGLGVEQDYTKAKSYYKKAADKNYEEAINALKELDAKSKNIS